MSIQKIAASVFAAGSLAAIPFVASATNGDGGVVTYQVTIENVTPPSSQPLSPVGVVIHGADVDVWSAGSPASAAVAAVAEDANLPIYADTYAAAPGVKGAFVGGDGPIGPGGDLTFEFNAKRNDRISIVSMLVNTNDAFTGLDSVRLGNETQEFEVGAYDAGTEINNENPDFIPGPAGSGPGVRDPEGGVITSHTGLVGQSGGIDLAMYGWDGPVARITITPLG
jgi:hypothetical protein